MKKLLIVSTLILSLNASNIYADKTVDCFERGDYNCALENSILKLEDDLKKYPKDSQTIGEDYNNIGLFYNISANIKRH